jgi:hypothetical protein
LDEKNITSVHNPIAVNQQFTWSTVTGAADLVIGTMALLCVVAGGAVLAFTLAQVPV